MKKILFIAAHRKDRAPSQRFRFEQYLDFLEQNGFECTFSPLVATPEEDELFYSSGNYFQKIPLGLKLGLRRLNDVRRADQFDFIFIARSAFITGWGFFERLFARSKAKIIFDFDDAIWMDVVSSNNRFFSWLKDGAQTRTVIELSDVVLAGNEYLATYARKFNKNVNIFPTTIDTEEYIPKYSNERRKITIGWSGSISTIEHFQYAVPPLKILKDKFGDLIQFKVIGDGNYVNAELGIRGLPWKKETELEDLQTIDVGIMPLPDNEWTWGKCGLKGLQYMALEIPTVMSPVGVNKEIIKDGFNGYLADKTDEWVDKISKLIEDIDLRRRMGQEGRKTVEMNYSVKANKNKFLSLINCSEGELKN